jgi:hypothetical protein
MSENTKALVATYARKNPSESATNFDALNLARNIDTLSDEADSLEAVVGAVQNSLATKQDNCVRVTYDFDTMGGDVGEILTGISIPADSTITYVYAHVITAPTSATDTGELTLLLSSGNDLTAAIVADGAATGNIGGIPDWTAANMEDVAALTELAFDIAAENLTAGKVAFFVFYNTFE